MATYHEEYARGLVEHTRRELEVIAPGSNVEVFSVPGSFEIPLVVQSVADRDGFDAIVAFGVLMEGQTAHAQLISSAVTDALMRISLSRHVPVVHEVLVIQTEEQARARCLEDEINRGTEAARVAVRMADVMNQFPRRQTR